MPDIRDIWLQANNMIRSGRQMINVNLQPLNLSSAEGNILLHLLTQGQGIAQERLVEQLDVSKPAISRALDSLESKRFITREQDSKDKRVHRIWLTEKALETGPTIEQVYNHVFSIALQGITQEELEFFKRLFGRVSENFAREQMKG